MGNQFRMAMYYNFSYLCVKDLEDVLEGYPKDYPTEFPPITSKQQFVREYKKGTFGNRAPTWDTLEEYLRSNYRGGLLHLRNRVAGGETFYDLSPGELVEKWDRIDNPKNFYCSAMAPHDKGLIQGEIQLGVTGLELYWAPALVPMREALAKEGKQVRGLLAVSLLKENLCPNSWEWLNVLLDRYPEHVIEFSSFSVCWGTLPNFNTVVWEVRLY